MKYEIAESHLYLCNCHNDSARVDPSWHDRLCAYRKWYESCPAPDAEKAGSNG